MDAGADRGGVLTDGAPPEAPEGSPHRGAMPRRLVDVATRLFAEKGFEGTSVQEIVEAAGVTKGALYHYFASKDDLLHEVYGRLLRMQTERLEAVAAGEGPLPARLHAAAADVVATTIDNLDDTVIFFRSMHLLHPDKQAAVRAARRRYHERFRGLVADGQRSGAFAADVPPDLVVDYFFGAVHHLPTWYRAGGALDGATIGRHYADLLLASLRPS